MMDNFEKQIQDQIQNDKLNFSADTAIHDRLMYHMQLKSAKTEIRKNSFLPAFDLLLTSKYLSVKVSIAAILLLSFMGYKQMNMNTSLVQLSDTVQVISNSDTIDFAIKDSVILKAQ